MAGDLRGLRAELNACGISRREAAEALCLSLSALNQKLRGERRLLEEEAEKLLALALKRRQPCP